MDSRIVRYARIGEVIVLKFPDEAGAKHFITQIETSNLLTKMGMDKMPIPSMETPLKPRLVA